MAEDTVRSVPSVMEAILATNGTGPGHGRAGDTSMNAKFLEALVSLRDDHPLLSELFQALRTCEHLPRLVIEPMLFRADRAAEERARYRSLGAALGAVRSIGTVWVLLRRTPGAATAVAEILRHMHHYSQLDVTMAIDGNARDDDFGVIRSVLCDKTSIENVYLKSFRISNPSSLHCETVGNLISVVSGLPCLRTLVLETGLDDRNASSLRPVLQVSSLRSLRLARQIDLGHKGAMEVCAAIAESRLEHLQVNDGKFYMMVPPQRSAATWPFGAVPPIAVALRAPHLQSLYLDSVNLLARESALAFAQALAGCQLKSLTLRAVMCHDDAIAELTSAICRPTLSTLMVSSASYFAAHMAKYFQQCSLLTSLDLSRISLRDEEYLMCVLAGCANCPQLTELRLPTVCTAWTDEIDEVVAHVVESKLRNLKQLYLKIVTESHNTSRNLTAPAFLAACRAHPAIEQVDLFDGSSLWRHDFLKELKRITEARRFRRRCMYLGEVGTSRGIVAPALSKAQSQPHLLYVGVTCCIPHLI